MINRDALAKSRALMCHCTTARMGYTAVTGQRMAKPAKPLDNAQIGGQSTDLSGILRVYSYGGWHLNLQAGLITCDSRQPNKRPQTGQTNLSECAVLMRLNGQGLCLDQLRSLKSITDLPGGDLRIIRRCDLIGSSADQEQAQTVAIRERT